MHFENFQGLLLAQRLEEGNGPTPGEIAQMIREGDGRLLKSLPIEHRTADLCERAVASDPWALQYVPEHVGLAPAVCDRAFRQLFFDLRALPARERTYERCILAFQSGRVLNEFLPAEKIDVPLAAWIDWSKRMNQEFLLNQRGDLQSSERLTALALSVEPSSQITTWIACCRHETSVRTYAIAIARTKGQRWRSDRVTIDEVPKPLRPRVLAAVSALEAGYTESNWKEHRAAMRDLIRPPRT